MLQSFKPPQKIDEFELTDHEFEKSENYISTLYQSKKTNDLVTIKFFPIELMEKIKKEVIILKQIKQSIQDKGLKTYTPLPQYYNHGFTLPYLIVNHFEPSLNIQNKKGLEFYQIAGKMFESIKEFHELGFIHNNIRPNIFKILNDKIYLTDFQFAINDRDIDTANQQIDQIRRDQQHSVSQGILPSKKIDYILVSYSILLLRHIPDKINQGYNNQQSMHEPICTMLFKLSKQKHTAQLEQEDSVILSILVYLNSLQSSFRACNGSTNQLPQSAEERGRLQQQVPLQQQMLYQQNLNNLQVEQMIRHVHSQNNLRESIFYQDNNQFDNDFLGSINSSFFFVNKEEASDQILEEFKDDEISFNGNPNEQSILNTGMEIIEKQNNSCQEVESDRNLKQITEIQIQIQPQYQKKLSIKDNDIIKKDEEIQKLKAIINMIGKENVDYRKQLREMQKLLQEAKEGNDQLQIRLNQRNSNQYQNCEDCIGHIKKYESLNVSSKNIIQVLQKQVIDCKMQVSQCELKMNQIMIAQQPKGQVQRNDNLPQNQPQDVLNEREKNNDIEELNKKYSHLERCHMIITQELTRKIQRFMNWKRGNNCANIVPSN
ncbi:UNKNOWN [Stylonychia lemnae]|uniref:Protein kinase domain-containing protein n=1 Tax=Stylonychia lemnae TaxID=5949 RepID=A0A077ZY04_STYLE|nr:UNKNOWN [Stylonychia lemnae]|eukprot:CDW73411.1 UNKNOWN [Stylonychia lemnae]